METDTDPRADLIRTMFAGSDSGDIDTFISCLTDDAVVVFGSYEPVAGKEAIRALSDDLLSKVASVRHEFHNIWNAVEDPDVYIAQISVHYTKLDRSIVSVPCATVFRMTGDLVAKYSVYMDPTGIFG